MITSLTHGAPAPPENRAEWWERQQAWRQRREQERPQYAHAVRRYRMVLSWAALGAVAVAAVADAAVRAGILAFGVVLLVLLLWFFVARTKTLSWRVVAALFACAVLWAVLIAGAQPVIGTRFSAVALLLAPLALLAIAVPGRVSRFSVGDWLITGATLGLAYQAVEAAAGAAADRLGAPPAVLAGAGTGSRHLTFTLLGLTIGLGVATVRHGRRLQGQVAVAYQVAGTVLPVAGLLVLFGAQFPATGDLPLPLAALRAAGRHTTALVVALAVLIVVAYLIDTRRMRATDEPGTDRIPYPYSPADAADSWTLTVVGPGNGGEGSSFFYLLTAAIWAACCMVTYLVRDALVIVGAHVRGSKEPLAQVLSRGRAAATLTRALRAEAFHPLDAPSRPNRLIARATGLAALVVLAAAGVLLPGLAHPPVQWLGLAGARLGQGASALGLSGTFAGLALAGLLLLVIGAPGTPADEAGARRLLLDQGRGVITFRDFDSPASRFAASTVSELVLDAVAAIVALIPGVVLRPFVRSAAGGPARAAVAEFCADPARLIVRRRRQLSAAPDDTGAILAVRTGSWDAGSRRRWVDSRITSRAHRITSADGRTSVPAAGLALAADGVVLLEAAHRHNPRAPMLYEGQAPPRLAERLLVPFDDEMRRYATVLRDPHNPITRLHLIVGSPAAAHLLGGRARDVLGADLDLVVRVEGSGGGTGATGRRASRVEA